MIRTVNFTYNNEKDILNAKKQLGPIPSNQILIQVFAGITDLEKIKSIRDQLVTHFSGASIIGTTSAGEIRGGHAYDRTTVISIMSFEKTTVKTFYTGDILNSSNSLEYFAEQGAKALQATNLRAVIVFAYGVAGNTFVNVLPFISSLKKLTPQATFAGGVAGVQSFDTEALSLTFTESDDSTYGIALAGLYSDDLFVTNAYNLSWVPIGKKLVIDEADGYYLKLVDGFKPVEIYSIYLGDGLIDQLPISAAEFPLILEREGTQIILHPEEVLPDGSMRMTHQLYAGERLQFSYCHLGLLALSAQNIYAELYNQDLQVNFAYSCAIRRSILGEDIDVELRPLAELSPSAGFFSYGEFYDEGTSSEYHRLGQTMTVLGLREGPKKPLKEMTTFEFIPASVYERRHFRTMRTLHRLIEKSASDLEMALVTLTQLAHKDALTGLYNRGYFDKRLKDELKRHTRSNTYLSLVLIDIDYFKAYNDTYGHLAGDDALRGVAHSIQNSVNRPDDLVARYGGEEMAVILPDTDYSGAVAVSEKIRAAIMALKIPHRNSQVAQVVTASIGVVTIHGHDIDHTNTTANGLVDLCDQCLYKAKDKGRNKVEGKKL